MRSSAFRRGLILLTCVAMLSGCSSVAKKSYIRHLSTTIPPSKRPIKTVAVTDRISESGVVAIAGSNTPKP